MPWVRIDKTEAGVAPVHRSGPGDASVFAEWSPPGTAFSFLAGVELPTGDAASAPGPGLVPASLLQEGSGTWDPLLGAAWAGGSGDWSYGARSYAQLPLGRSRAGLDPGNLLHFSAGAEYAVAAGLRAGLHAEAEFRSRDFLASAPLANTGSALYFLRPRARLTAGQGIFAEASARIPVLRQVNAVQIVPGTLFTLSVGVEF